MGRTKGSLNKNHLHNYCLYCKKLFRTPRRKRKFCSISCGLKSHQSNRKGKKIVIKDDKYKTHRNWQKNQWHHRKRASYGSHTFKEWEILKEKNNWKCLSCGEKEPKIKLTQDHILPLSKGGSDNISNIQPLCKSCNCRKMTKTIIY